MQFSFAAEVLQVKADKILLADEENYLEVGDQAILLDSAGKRLGVIEVKAIRGMRVLAYVLRGKAIVGATVDTSRKRTREDRNYSFNFNTKNAFGLAVGYNMQSFTFLARTTGKREELTLKGNNVAIKGFYDYDFNKYFTTRYVGGFNFYNVKGSPGSGSTAFCNDTADCDARYDYLTLEAHAVLNLFTAPSRFWISLGYVFFFAPNATTNVNNLDTSSRTNWMIAAQVGTDLYMNERLFIPVFYQYGWFDSGSEIYTTSSAIYTGIGSRF